MGWHFFQRPFSDRRRHRENGEWRMVVRVSGVALQSVMDQVLATIKQAGYRPSDLYRSRRAPFLLDEELGVRLGLLFLAVKPLRKVSRITEISEQVRGMAVEEAYYWFSKTTDHGSGRRSQKALRILLARE
ncbi:MAG: hypothetical protein KatS3mg082_1981 [Nitrospiraceae bacterium]|nr:MAG: hypothetical protein KatS3mg082_1981 [Nitrospiraceae bacterium]